MKFLKNAVLDFLKNTLGNFAIIVALAMPGLFGSMALGSDYYVLYNKKSELQATADADALAAAKERIVANGNEKYFQEVANSFVSAQYGIGEKDGSGDFVDVKTTVTDKPFGVKVEIIERWTPFFAHFLNTGVTPIKVEATAAMAGSGFVCVVGLMNYKDYSSIHLDQKSHLFAENCGLYSNTASKTGFRADGNSVVRAYSICSVGGYYQHNGVADVEPKPMTDCPKIADPLADRANPKVGKCKYTDLVITENMILMPGTYCGGIQISGNAKVTLDPGVYVIKNGPLVVEDDAELLGTNVGFFLTGGNSVFNFTKNSKVDITAPVTGALAGLLFFEDRNVGYSFKNFDPLKPWLVLDADGKNIDNDGVRIHVISSNYARNLLGTFYLKNSILLINSTEKVADKSAYTAIITARLWLQEGPTLVLNSDYKSTNVPVPENLINDEVILVK